MKKLFIVMVIALLTVSAATAEGFLIPKAKPHMAPGAFAASVGVNLGYGSVGVAGGVENDSRSDQHSGCLSPDLRRGGPWSPVDMGQHAVYGGRRFRDPAFSVDIFQSARMGAEFRHLRRNRTRRQHYAFDAYRIRVPLWPGLSPQRQSRDRRRRALSRLVRIRFVSRECRSSCKSRITENKKGTFAVPFLFSGTLPSRDAFCPTGST